MTEGRIIRRSVSSGTRASESAPSMEKRFGDGMWKWNVIMDGYKTLIIYGRTPEELNANIAKRLGIERAINSA